MDKFDLRHQSIQSAIAKIQARAERQSEEVSLHNFYVDYGPLSRLQGNKNEIITGRRGTGKTHLLKTFIEKELISSERNSLLLYIDCNKLDSGRASAVVDSEQEAEIKLNRLCAEIKSFLLVKATDLERPDQKREDEIVDVLTSYDNACSKYFKSKSINGSRDMIVSLERAVELLGSRLLIIILDEWVALLDEVQPFLAERLKRLFFSSSKICFKIASIDYRSSMRIERNGRMIGFEKGADIFYDIDLDDYLVHDTNKEHVEEIFAEILYNHILIHLPQKNAALSLSRKEKVEFVKGNFFTTKDALIELIRAGEGVVRDFLQIFTYAYFNHFLLNKKEAKIGVPDIRKAARDWYQRDKLNAITGNMRLSDCLSEIIDKVIGDKKARSFMVKQGLSRHGVILALYDARLLHLIRKGWSYRREAGIRYDIFTIDYGVYVEKINTSSSPQIELFQDIDSDKDSVPYDDKRSIRSIVLPDNFLDKFSAK
jgi:hypothetical protein